MRTTAVVPLIASEANAGKVGRAPMRLATSGGWTISPEPPPGVVGRSVVGTAIDPLLVVRARPAIRWGVFVHFRLDSAAMRMETRQAVFGAVFGLVAVAQLFILEAIAGAHIDSSRWWGIFAVLFVTNGLIGAIRRVMRRSTIHG